MGTLSHGEWCTLRGEYAVRMVFDNFSKTPGGNSLTRVFTKGQIRLYKLKHLLIWFRK
jgi:hypothetical protein